MTALLGPLLIYKFATLELKYQPELPKPYLNKNKILNCLQSRMSLHKCLSFWLLYIGLAGLSFLFVSETLKEYVEKKTTYHTSISPITQDDIPTLTICFNHQEPIEPQNGKHFSITSHIPKNASEYIFTKLVEGENYVTILETNQTYRLILRSLKVRQNQRGIRRKCIKITPLNTQFKSFDFHIHSFNKSKPEKAHIYITSEENAYGVIFQRWFNGRVLPYILLNGTFHQVLTSIYQLNNSFG